MQRTASFFDRTLFFKGVKRTMPLWLTHFVIWVLAMPVMVANAMDSVLGVNHTDILEIGEYVLYTVHIGGTMMSCFFCAVIAGVQNNYLMNARSTSFYHALPVRRSTIYTTNLLVTLSTTVLPAALVGLMTLGVEMTKGYGLGGLPALMQWLGIYMLQCLFFTGFANLCIHATGHVAAAPVIYAILNFTAVAVEYVVRYIPTLFLYGLTYIGELRATKLSPIWHIYSHCGPDLIYENMEELRNVPVELSYKGMGYLVGLAVVGLVMMVLGWLLYRVRHSEQAGEIIAIKPLRPAFKYCVTLGFTLILSIVLYAVCYMARVDNDSSPLWFTICMLVSAAIGYFGSEMLLQKSFRVWKKSRIGFLVCAVLICLGGASLRFDLFGVETYIPNADEVEHLVVDANYRGYDLDIYPDDAGYTDAVALHQLIVDNKEINREMRNARDNGGPVDTMTTHYMWVRFHYYLKNGMAVDREYLIPAWQYDSENDNIYAEIDDFLGYHAPLKALYDDQVFICRAFPSFFEEADQYEIYHVNVYPYNRYEGKDELIFSNMLYGKLEEAVRKDIEAGTLIKEYEAYYKTVEPKEQQEEPWYDLNIDQRKPAEYGDGYQYDYHYFTVTPAAEHTYALLNDENNYISGDIPETVIVTKD
ncbi:MAG: hypothetical protein IKU27_08825 [Clostridia bacterium]|nr:hypothetical protein [Clostridia bacterium]